LPSPHLPAAFAKPSSIVIDLVYRSGMLLSLSATAAPVVKGVGYLHAGRETVPPHDAAEDGFRFRQVSFMMP